MSNASTETQTLFETLTRPIMRRAIVTVALAGMLTPGISACYGTFPITNAVYEFNGKVTKWKFVHSIVMIVFAFIGVYGIAMLIDAVVLNLIEFWSGEEFHTAMEFEQPDGTVIVLAPGAESNQLVMTVLRDGEVIEERSFLRHDDGLVAVTDKQGNSVGTVRPTAEGGFDLLDAEGNTKDTLTFQQIAMLRTANQD